MTKSRDKKVMITKEAIQKVPYIRYREIPEQEYAFRGSIGRSSDVSFDYEIAGMCSGVVA